MTLGTASVAVGPTKTYSAGLSSSWALGYSFAPARQGRPRLGLRLTRSTSAFGETTGYHDPLTFVFLRSSATVTAALATATLGRTLRVGLGPSLNRIRMTDVSGGGQETLAAARRPGLVAEGAWTFPPGKRLFVELSGQYRLTGSAHTRGYDIQEGLGRTYRTVPAMRLPLSHTALALGIGLRL